MKWAANGRPADSPATGRRRRNRDRETKRQRDRETERRRDGETERFKPLSPYLSVSPSLRLFVSLSLCLSSLRFPIPIFRSDSNGRNCRLYYHPLENRFDAAFIPQR